MKNNILVSIIIAILLAIYTLIFVHDRRVKEQLENITPCYDVYYEYSIIDKDTIPIDTIVKYYTPTAMLKIQVGDVLYDSRKNAFTQIKSIKRDVVTVSGLSDYWNDARTNYLRAKLPLFKVNKMLVVTEDMLPTLSFVYLNNYTGSYSVYRKDTEMIDQYDDTYILPNTEIGNDSIILHN